LPPTVRVPISRFVMIQWFMAVLLSRLQVFVRSNHQLVSSDIKSLTSNHAVTG
jgi:hypothetical protein